MSKWYEVLADHHAIDMTQKPEQAKRWLAEIRAQLKNVDNEKLCRAIRWGATVDQNRKRPPTVADIVSWYRRYWTQSKTVTGSKHEQDMRDRILTAADDAERWEYVCQGTTAAECQRLSEFTEHHFPEFKRPTLDAGEYTDRLNKSVAERLRRDGLMTDDMEELRRRRKERSGSHDE